MTIHIELLNYILYYALTQLRQKRRPNVNLTVQIRYICALFFFADVLLRSTVCSLLNFSIFLLYIHFYLVEETIVKRNEQSDK